MTRGTMRTILRRRLNETVADLWTDSDLNELLNEGLRIVQVEVMAHYRDAFMAWATTDLVASQSQYPKPAGMFFETQVGIKDSTAVGGYKPLEKRDYYVARDWTSTTSPVYCHEGTYFGIYPAPSASLAAGLQAIYVPLLSMATDTDVPELHIGLHMAVVLTANLLAIGETGDPSAEIKNMLAPILARIPMVYGDRSATTNERLSLDYAAMGREEWQ